MEFCTEDYFVFRNWRCAEALKCEKNLSPWGQVDFYLRRREVEWWCLWACLGSKVCLSLRAAVWNSCYTMGQCIPQFAVLLSFTLDENGFAHVTMAKPAAILQLSPTKASLQLQEWSLTTTLCLCLPHLWNQPAVPGTLTLHSWRARKTQTLFGSSF